jgi:hypothetical protein
MEKIRASLDPDAFSAIPYPLAATLFKEIIVNPELEEFLTLRAYEYLD